MPFALSMFVFHSQLELPAETLCNLSHMTRLEHLELHLLYGPCLEDPALLIHTLSCFPYLITCKISGKGPDERKTEAKEGKIKSTQAKQAKGQAEDNQNEQ